MNMYRTIKGKKIHVNQLAAMSRKFTVRNSTVPKTDLNSKNIITMFKEINTVNYNIPVKGKMFEVDKDGHYHLVDIDHSWKEQRNKQPKRLIKCKKRKYSKARVESNENWPDRQYVKTSRPVKPGRDKRNDFVKFFPNYPYNLPKMNKQQYMEKLVQHKLEKWDKKNPKPQQDLFDKVEDWEQRRFIVEQRFRDFVVSVYDPLTLTGRFVVGKGNSATYQEKKVAEIKDINGEGHVVNNLSNNSKLMKKVQRVTNHMRNKYPNLVSCHLMDHKKQHGRIILPQAA